MKKKRLSGKARARVLIAKDVLKYLSIRDITPQNVYFVFNGGNHLISGENTELKTILDANPSCSVCGIGAAFYAQIRRFDNFKVGNLKYGHVDALDMREKLKDFFTPLQIAMIESAYEQCDFGSASPGVGDGHQSVVLSANYFFRHFQMTGRDFRMRAIFTNIIENNGTFNPHKKVNLEVEVKV